MDCDHSESALFRSLAVLLGAAAFLVTCSGYALQFGAPPEPGTAVSILKISACLTNIVILFAAYALAFAVASKVSTALLFVSPIYIVLGLSTIAKLRYMHSPVSPLDLLFLGEFLPFFRQFFGVGVTAASVGGLVAWVLVLVALRKTTPIRMLRAHRMAVGAVSLAVLLAIPANGWFPTKQGKRINRLIGGPQFHLNDTADLTRSSGFLLTFLAEIPASFVTVPPDYSPETVAAALRRFRGHGVAPAAPGRGKQVNLIICMVESFMYPEDLGWRYSADPIPKIRELRKTGIGGYGIVPGKYGGSSNSEFEVLTGMSMAFLPERSIPYRQFVTRPIPSLPAALKRSGYRTVAVQADPREFFNREKVYGLLGFDEMFWLHEAPDIERSPDGFWPSDEAVVDTVIRASRKAGPFFIFAFPSSTHSPYHRGIYRDSNLGVLDPLHGYAAKEVKEYVNTLRTTDRAIGRLVKHFRGRPEPTMIVVIGDHLPPLSDASLGSFNARLARLPKTERELKSRSVPLLVWANFDLPREETNMSTNALASYLLEKMSIPSMGFLGKTGAVHRRLPILSDGSIGDANGSLWDRDSLPLEERMLLGDYHTLQYDLLIGKRYALRSIVE